MTTTTVRRRKKKDPWVTYMTKRYAKATDSTIDEAREALQSGADAHGVALPYYLKVWIKPALDELKDNL